MMTAMTREFRADHTGSLLRPRELRDEVHRIYEAGHTALYADERAKDLTRLHELEDAAIRRVLARQEELGLRAVTDGEFRRIAYFNSFYDAIDGVAPSTRNLQFRDDDGSVVEYEGPAVITSRVAKIDSPAAREVAFLKKHTDRTVKVCFPTASFVTVQAILGDHLSSSLPGQLRVPLPHAARSLAGRQPGAVLPPLRPVRRGVERAHRTGRRRLRRA